MLASLRSLRLHYNYITGTIPSELGALSSLRYVLLQQNPITGTIPSELGMLSTMVDLRLHNNRITGTIPSEVGKLSLLRNLYLNSHFLSGTTPSELFTLSSLQNFDLHGNKMSDTIPFELGNSVTILSLARFLLRLDCCRHYVGILPWFKWSHGDIAIGARTVAVSITSRYSKNLWNLAVRKGTPKCLYRRAETSRLGLWSVWDVYIAIGQFSMEKFEKNLILLAFLKRINSTILLGF